MRNIQRLLIILLYSMLCLNTLHADDIIQSKRHPRLFLNNQRVEELKTQNDEVSLQLKEIVIQNAEAAILLPPIVYPEKGPQVLFAMRETQRRILCLSMSYLLTSQEHYLSAAKEILMRLSALDNWGPGHFLDVAEATLAAGVGLDWLYDKLSMEERQSITRAIIINSLRPALTMHESDDKSSWVNGDFNWNSVCHGGTIIGALAIDDADPPLSKQIIDRAVKNLPTYAMSFEPDGSDAEGPSYWSYGASFYIIATEALRTAIGSARGLDQYQGFLKSGDYNIQVVGVTGSDFNYSDYHIEHLNEPVMFWFGRELKRYDLVRQEIKDIQTMYKQLKTKKVDNPNRKERFPNRHVPFELLWWNPELLASEMKVAPLHYTALGGLPLGITRSSWTDSHASFIAIKGGTANHSHAHMDVGSFIIEANGVRWAVDLGTESYDQMRAAKLDLWNYSQNSSRWTTFRVGPEAHNILRFDNEYQNIKGHGTIQPLSWSDGTVGHQVDLSPVYSAKASSVQRSVLLHPDGSLSIHDVWITINPATIVSWQWLTEAEVVKTNKGLLLRQNGESLEIKIESVKKMSELKIKVEDISKPRNLQDSPNPGLKRIVIELPGGNIKGNFQVKVIPGTHIH